MKKRLETIFKEAEEVKKASLENNVDFIISSVNVIVEAFKNNKKLIIFGNGGSAADSQHIAAEFIGRFQQERIALPAIALTTDTSILTALSNDYSFDIIFERQIEGLANDGDVAIGISTSGNSKNVISGIKKAKEKGLKTISFTGCSGGALSKLTDISIIVPSNVTARIQEVHICIAHAICELVEKEFVK